MWKPFASLEKNSQDVLRTKWLLKTSKDAWKEWTRMENLSGTEGKLKDHWRNRGAEERPNREVSAWPSFLSSYSDAPKQRSQRVANFKALPSQETESAAVEVGAIHQFYAFALPRLWFLSSAGRHASTGESCFY